MLSRGRRRTRDSQSGERVDGSSGADKIRHLSLSSTESEEQRDRPSHLPTTATKHPFSFPPVSFQYVEGRGLG